MFFAMDRYANSKKLLEAAEKMMPGGVSSPVRAFRNVGGTPPFITRAKGSHIWDADGNEYIDYVGSWGPMILGHAHPKVVAAVGKAIENGLSFGAPTELEIKLASTISAAIPSMEMLRFVSSGTEATMSAIRLARGATGRDKILKFEGCYHGHADSLLVKAGSGAATFGVPTSKGVTKAAASDTIVAKYNDIDGVKKIFEHDGKNIAAVIVEPVAGNMGCVPPVPNFLETLRKLTEKCGALLIFDEVMTGFRVSYGGAQGLYKIRPDITCLGKIIGGGLPVGAYGGAREIMKNIAPLGAVYQAGTLSGNPVSMTAGIETLKILSEPGTYEVLEKKSAKLCTGIKNALSSKDIPHKLNCVGSMWSIFFESEEIFKKFFHFMLDHGIYLAPSAFESAFVSLAHTDEDIEKTIEAVLKFSLP